jgi:hypothetical protein
VGETAAKARLEQYPEAAVPYVKRAVRGDKPAARVLTG